jgi:hypothetical protein
MKHLIVGHGPIAPVAALRDIDEDEMVVKVRIPCARRKMGHASDQAATGAFPSYSCMAPPSADMLFQNLNCDQGGMAMEMDEAHIFKNKGDNADGFGSAEFKVCPSPSGCPPVFVFVAPSPDSDPLWKNSGEGSFPVDRVNKSNQSKVMPQAPEPFEAMFHTPFPYHEIIILEIVLCPL